MSEPNFQQKLRYVMKLAFDSGDAMDLATSFGLPMVGSVVGPLGTAAGTVIAPMLVRARERRKLLEKYKEPLDSSAGLGSGLLDILLPNAWTTGGIMMGGGSGVTLGMLADSPRLGAGAAIAGALLGALGGRHYGHLGVRQRERDRYMKLLGEMLSERQLEGRELTNPPQI